MPDSFLSRGLTGLVSILFAGTGCTPDTDGPFQIALSQGATSVEQAAARVFTERIRIRAGNKPVMMVADTSIRSLVVGTAQTNEVIRQHPEIDTPGRDGFQLITTPDARGRAYVIGQNPRGVVAGLGKLLRISRVTPGVVTVPAVTLTEAPALPIRGLYIATHFHNFYHSAPLPEVDRIIEDLALWGANSLGVSFTVSEFESFHDPLAQAHLARLAHFGETATALGMDFGLLLSPNGGYAATPEALRREWIPASPNSFVCPSKAGGMDHLGQIQRELLGAFSQIDFLISFPHDHGGCGCSQCAPWGGNGFLRASEQLQGIFRRRFPGGRFWLATWIFDKPPLHGEYDAFFRYLADTAPSWVDGIVMDGLENESAGRIHERPQPERWVLTSFPEISMTGHRPWGTAGAAALPQRWSGQFDELRGKTAGGWPYSEGIYEDLNKFLWIQHYWDPKRPMDELLGEYAAAYFAPSRAEEGVRLLRLLENAHNRHRWSVENLERADEAWQLAQAIDQLLEPAVRSSWRWRLVHLRAQFDHTLRHKGYISPEARAALAPLLEEIRSIYHATPETTKLVRPLSLFDPDTVAAANADNLAFQRPVRTSSTFPSSEFVDSGWALTDGSISAQEREGFFNFEVPTEWASNPVRDQEPRILIDLGETCQIREVRVQFRGAQTLKPFRASFSWPNHVYRYVPSSLRFAVSENGEDFVPAGASVEVPAEGTLYETRLWEYSVEGRGRYLQVSLGPSQHRTGRDAGLVKLSQIQVFGR